MGWMRLATGSNQLGIEAECVWATPASYTEENFPCYEDGSNCVIQSKYKDPSKHGLVSEMAALK